MCLYSFGRNSFSRSLDATDGLKRKSVNSISSLPVTEVSSFRLVTSVMVNAHWLSIVQNTNSGYVVNRSFTKLRFLMFIVL